MPSEWFQFSAGVRHGCNIAPDLFLEPMDWVMDRTVHRGFAGISVGSQVFTDLDFADDVAVLSEMLEILILSLEILYYEALPLGLEINWDKTKIQGSVFNTANPASVSVLGNPVELVESFTYLGCRIDACGGCEEEILRSTEIARGCMVSLTKNIWRSSITLCEDTTVQYLCSTGPTVRLRIAGCDGEVRQAT